MNWPEP